MVKYCLNILLLILVAGNSYAQVTFTSLEEIWRYADDHNITIKTAKYEAEKASMNKMQAYGALLPQAGVSGSFTDNTAIPTNIIDGSLFGAPGTYRILKLGQQYVYNGYFNAQLDILNLQNIFSAQVAKRTAELNEASLANTRKTIYQQLATQYYSYMLMQEAARLTDESYRVADSVYQSVNNKFVEGALSEANADVAKLNMQRASQSHITAVYQMRIARNNIKALLGFSLADSVSISSVLQNNAPVADASIFEQDPAIRLAMTQVRIAQSQYRAANSSFAPTISLVYNTGTTQYDSAYRPFTTNEAPWFPATYWSVRATLPLFTGGSRYFQSRKMKINYLESKAQYENAIRQSAITDENLRLSYRRSVEVLIKAEDVMNLSKDNYRHISYKYAAGVTSLDDRLKAFSDYIEYQNAYLNSLSDMLVQLYQIKIRQQSF